MPLDIYDGRTILAPDNGPPGTPAAQDIQLGFSNGYHPNEALDEAGVAHAVTLVQGKCLFLSRTPPTSVRVFTIRRNLVQIGTATMDPATAGLGPVYFGTVALISTPLALAVGDLIDWLAPPGVDATLVDGVCVLGSL